MLKLHFSRSDSPVEIYLDQWVENFSVTDISILFWSFLTYTHTPFWSPTPYSGSNTTHLQIPPSFLEFT